MKRAYKSYINLRKRLHFNYKKTARPRKDSGLSTFIAIFNLFTETT